MAVVVVAGCDASNDPAGKSAESGGVTATAESAAGSATPSAAPTADADAKTACTAISGDIKTALGDVAKAEKIGPPAGHFAVSAAYSAGATAISADMINTSSNVNDAADQVATAMSGLADIYGTNPKQTPNKAALDTAIKQFNTVCGS